MLSLHETGGSICYTAHDNVPMAMYSDDISICSTEEMEKYESLCQREFGRTRVYDVNLLERVGMDKSYPPSSGPSVRKNSTMNHAVEGIG
jgi:hypothetical protein